jgi:hypothetical protein
VIPFKGIHYGATTAGSNRFKRPRPLERWTGVRDATSYGPAAPQGATVIDPVSVLGSNPGPTSYPDFASSAATAVAVLGRRSIITSSPKASPWPERRDNGWPGQALLEEPE